MQLLTLLTYRSMPLFMLSWVCVLWTTAGGYQRANQFSLKLKELQLDEATLTNPDQVSQLPFPSIDREVPERIFAPAVDDLHRRTFAFMGRERLTELMNELNSLSVGGKSIAEARKNKRSAAAVPQPTFRQMLIYGSPGWGKVGTHHHTHAIYSSPTQRFTDCRCHIATFH